MHTVLSLFKHQRLAGFKYFIGHFHLGDAETLTHLGTDLGLQIMECRKTVHENGLLAGIVHDCFIHLIRRQLLNTLGPYFVGSPMDTHTSV